MRAAAAVVAGGLLLGACGGSASTSTSTLAAPARIQVSSPAFANGAPIPRRYTCTGQDISPPLRWSGIPRGARDLVLEMQDRDASDPSAPGGEFVHWIVRGIPPRLSGLEQGHLPAGAGVGLNSFGKPGYRGPCPPHGDPPHHYVITLIAVGSSRPLASGTLVGTYGRS
jgi:Raf kinase inhibitor-like YbhB/YbcL family protein